MATGGIWGAAVYLIPHERNETLLFLLIFRHFLWCVLIVDVLFQVRLETSEAAATTIRCCRHHSMYHPFNLEGLTDAGTVTGPIHEPLPCALAAAVPPAPCKAPLADLINALSLANKVRESSNTPTPSAET